MTERNFYENFNKILKERGLSVSAVANLANIQPSTLLRYVKRGPVPALRADLRAAVAQALGVSVEAMESKSELKPASAGFGAVPVWTEDDLLRYASADRAFGGPTLPTGMAAFSAAGKELVPAPIGEKPSDETGRGTIAVRMNSEALSPEIMLGDMVYFRLYDHAEDFFGLYPKSYFALAVIDGKYVAIRKLIKGEMGEDWLTATNPSWPGEKTIKGSKANILGVAIAVYRKL